MINEGLFTSNTDEWATPQALFDEWNAKYHFTLDVAASAENAKCERYYTKEDDGLSKPWKGRVWCNPPYGREIGKWVEKGFRCDAASVVMLLPARTDTRWFHDYCMKGEIHFIKGRVKFGGAKWNAPFPSMIVVFDKK